MLGFIWIILMPFWLLMNEGIMQENYVIHFERSGGFAGLITKVDIDSKDLSIEEQKNLEKLINNSGILTREEKMNMQNPMPDQFQYTFNIRYDHKQLNLILTEEQVTDKIRPLIKYLLRKARE